MQFIHYNKQMGHFFQSFQDLQLQTIEISKRYKNKSLKSTEEITRSLISM